MSVYINNFETIYGVKNNMQALRNKVLELAIQGKLIVQNPNDEPASELVKKIQIERDKLVKEGEIKKQKPPKSISKNEIPLNLPENWALVRLGTIAISIKGVTFSKNDARKEFDSNYDLILRGGNIHPKTEKLLFVDNLYIPKGIIKIEQHLKMGDTILVASSGTKSSIAKSAYITETINDTSVGAFLFIIRPLKVEPLFIRYLIKFFRQRIIDDTSGTNINNVGKEQLDNFLIPLPPLAEQLRIVAKIESIMSDIDKLEEYLQKKEYLMKLLPKAVVNAIGSCQTGEELKEQFQFIIKNFATIFQTSESMQELRNVILQLAIEGKLVPQDSTDEPASKLIKRIQIGKDKFVEEGKIKKQKRLVPIDKDEIPFEIPESWEWIRLGDTGNTQTGTTPSTSVIEYYHGDVPFIKPADISSKTINYDNESLTQLGLKVGRVIKKNSNMMVCIGGSIGKTYFTNRDCSCNQQINTLSPYSQIDYIYMHSVLSSPYFYNQIWSKSSGTATPIINKSTWESILIPLPPFAEQCRIVKKIESIMSLIDQMENDLKLKVDLVEKMAIV